MTYTYTFIPEKEIILVRMTGSVNYTIFTQALYFTWSNDKYKAHYSTLLDLSDAHVMLNAGEISKLIELLLTRKRGQGAKFTVIAKKPFEAALAMVFESKLTQALETRAFNNLESAADFLSIDSNEVNQYLETEAETVSLEDILRAEIN